MDNVAIHVLTKIQLYPDRVIKHYKQSQKRILFRQGAYIAKSMRNSMRYASKKKTHSEPGQPPLAHKEKGALLRKLIRFAVDLTKGQVIIGPIKFGSASQPVPELLDQGGTYRPNKKQVKARFPVGGVGPIRTGDRPGAFVFGKLTTSAQVDRATQLAVGENQLRTANAAIHIAPRPFTTPRYTDGGVNFRKLIETTK